MHGQMKALLRVRMCVRACVRGDVSVWMPTRANNACQIEASCHIMRASLRCIRLTLFLH